MPDFVPETSCGCRTGFRRSHDSRIDFGCWSILVQGPQPELESDDAEYFADAFIAITASLEGAHQSLLIHITIAGHVRVREQSIQARVFPREASENSLGRIALAFTIEHFRRQHILQRSTLQRPFLTGPDSLVAWNCLHKLHQRPVKNRVTEFGTVQQRPRIARGNASYCGQKTHRLLTAARQLKPERIGGTKHSFREIRAFDESRIVQVRESLREIAFKQ